MRILCVTSVRNEAPFLLEWIAHMQGAGVTDFLIYSNDCEDGTDALLDALDTAGTVDHIPQTVEAGQSPQWQAFRAAWKHPKRKAADWAIVCDVDEFPNIHAAGHTFPDLIAALPDGTDGILLPWRLFGNNGVARFTDAPVTKQFTRAAPPDLSYPISTTFFKALFRTDGPFNQFGIHRPKQKSPNKAPLPRWVDGSGRPMPDGFAKNEKRLSLFGLSQGRGLVECNHYSLKSAESFLIKRARGLPNRSEKPIDLSYWVDRNFNTVEDTSITKMRPATEAALAKLHTIPDIPALHAAGVSWHQTRFLNLIKDEPTHVLFTQLLLAGDSKTLDPATAMQLVAWYQNVER